MLVVALPGKAQASATGCVWSQPTPISCVKVVGAGTWVDSVAGGVNLAARQSARGHFRVYGHGFSVYTSDATYWNQSWWHRQTFWGPSFRMNRNLPAGSNVCAAFYDLQRGWRPPACVRIG
jgi:hypothetical protein